MGSKLRLRHRKRPFALARPHQHEAHAGPGRVDPCRGLQQRRDALLPRQARDRDDDLGGAEAKLLPKLGRGGSRCHALVEAFDVDARAWNQVARPPALHAVPFEVRLVLAVLEHRRRRGPGRNAVQCAKYWAQSERGQRVGRVHP